MKRILLIALMVYLSGCQSTDSQERDGYMYSFDEFKGVERYKMIPEGPLDGAPIFTYSEAFIDTVLEVKNEKVYLGFFVILHYENWVWINSGESLVLLVDGNPMTLSSPRGSNGNRGILQGLLGKVAGVRIREEAMYPISPEQLRTLAQAKEVKVKIYGSKNNVERSLSSDHIESIGLFYDSVVRPRINRNFTG